MRKRLSIVIVAAILVLFSTPLVSIANPKDSEIPDPGSASDAYYNYHVLSGGIDVIYYHRSASVNSYVADISYACQNWMYPGWYNPIDLVYSTDYTNTTVDFYARNMGNISTIAYTTFFVYKNTQISPFNSNWDYAEIHFNTNKMSPGDPVDRGTIIHEIGHAMGLNHQNNNVYSIMCQLGAGRIRHTVNYIDNYHINQLY